MPRAKLQASPPGDSNLCTVATPPYSCHAVPPYSLTSAHPRCAGYLSITLGADLVALYLFSLADATRQWAQIVLHYGRSPLAFYITHWYILTTIALIIYSATNWAGVPLAAVIPFYMLVIFLEYFLVVWYDDFKQGKGPNSLWRLL